MTHCREPSGESTGLLQLCIYCLYATNPEIHSIYFCLTPFVCEYNSTCFLKAQVVQFDEKMSEKNLASITPIKQREGRMRTRGEAYV